MLSPSAPPPPPPRYCADFTRSFPDPSSSHTQSRRRNCPPMRNGSAACWRRTRSVRPAESRGDIRCGARCGPGGGEEDRWGGDRACSVQGKARLESGRRSRAKCTSNITSKFVTLDVSQLSGWLNALAPYRAERRAYDAGRSPVGRRPCMQRAREVKALDWSRSAGHGRSAPGTFPP